MKEHPIHRGYFVTKDGKVFSTFRAGGVNHRIENAPPKELTQTRDARGYSRVCIQVDRYVQKRFSVHRLVAETYLPNPKPEEYTVIHHKDKNPLNNNVENLEWCTHKQNCLYSRHNIGQNKATHWLIENVNTNETFVIFNLSEWCQNNDLNKSNLHKTLTEETRKQHKGYRIIKKLV